MVIDGYQLVLIDAGPEFPPTPAISLMLTFDPAAAATLDAVWAGLLDGGESLMDLGEYPFSPRYGWVRHRFGATWQLLLAAPDAAPRPFVMPALLFCGPVQGRARAAITHYMNLFEEAEAGVLVDASDQAGDGAPTGEPVDAAAMYADFTLVGQWFVAMDSGAPQDFSFTCGVSLQVNCAGQAEIDRFWDGLSAIPAAEQCDWYADEFGVSWQIVPADMDARMAALHGWTAMMGIKKLVLADLPLP